jgi:preprotein translocase subunit SecD
LKATKINIKRMAKISFFGLILLATSCAIPKYVHVYESNKGLDLRTGKWLVSYVDGDVSHATKQIVTTNLIEGFKKMGVDTIESVDNIFFEYITVDKFVNDISMETLNMLGISTEYNYIISVQVNKIKDELSGIMISAPEKESKSISEVVLKVHDIKNGQKIYHHKISGSVTMDEEYTDVSLAKSANGLILGALDKALKEIDKYSSKK